MWGVFLTTWTTTTTLAMGRLSWPTIRWPAYLSAVQCAAFQGPHRLDPEAHRTPPPTEVSTAGSGQRLATARKLAGFLWAMAPPVPGTPYVPQTDRPWTHNSAAGPRLLEEAPPRSGATLDGVKRPVGTLGHRVQQAPDGYQSGGANSRLSARSALACCVASSSRKRHFHAIDASMITRLPLTTGLDQLLHAHAQRRYGIAGGRHAPSNFYVVLSLIILSRDLL